MSNTEYEAQTPPETMEPEAEAAAEETPKVTNSYFWDLFDKIRAQRKKKHRSRLQRLGSLPKFDETVQPAMERLTDELIAQTVGKNGLLTQEFRAQLARYNPEENPIGPNELRALVLSMLDLAAAQRKLLNERLERSVEVGSLYKSYYGRVQAVNTLAAEAITDLERMELAEEDYRYHSGVLLKVRDYSILSDHQPDDQAKARVGTLREKMNNRQKDIMQELDKWGELE